MKQVTKSTKKSLSAGQLLLVLVMLAVVVWAVSLIVSKALFDTISFNNRLISRKRSVDSTLGANVDLLDTLKAKYDEVEQLGPGAKKVLRALPDTYDVPALVAELEALIGSSGVSFNQFGLSSTPATDTTDQTDTTASTSGSTDTNGTPSPQEIVFDIDIGGSYSNIVKVLSNLEHEISPMRITKLELSGSVSDANAKIEIKTFYQNRVSTQFSTEKLE